MAELQPKERKAYIVLAVAGIFALLFGFWQIGRNIKNPFKLQPKQDALNQDIFADQTKDTDGDGLTDFEETNFYNTSPYLEDSDSDSLTDGQEIQAGTDPNCPSGKACGAQIQNTESAGGVVAPDPSVQLDAALNTIQNLTPADIRKILKDGGMSDADLNKLSDSDLMQIYQEALQANQ